MPPTRNEETTRREAALARMREAVAVLTGGPEEGEEETWRASRGSINSATAELNALGPAKSVSPTRRVVEEDPSNAAARAAIARFNAQEAPLSSAARARLKAWEPLVQARVRFANSNTKGHGEARARALQAAADLSTQLAEGANLPSSALEAALALQQVAARAPLDDMRVRRGGPLRAMALDTTRRRSRRRHSHRHRHRQRRLHRSRRRA